MQTFVFVDIFNIEFEVGASAEVWGHDCDLALKGWSLDSKVSFLGAVFVSDSTGGVFVGKELLAVEEVINLTFGFEEDDNGAFFAVDIFDVFDDGGVKF